MISKRLEEQIYQLWNEGNSAGVIAQKLFLDVGYVNGLVARARKKGVSLRKTPPVKRARQIGF